MGKLNRDGITAAIVLFWLLSANVFSGTAAARPTERIFRDSLRGGGYGPEMVILPAGSFMMGDRQGVGYSFEQPVHQVTFRNGFAIGKHEVTFEEYDRFCAETGHAFPADDGYGREQRPVINVTWHEANSYAEWLSRKTGMKYRLPTEAEWEYAARGGTKDAHYWGEGSADACRFANVSDRGLLSFYPEFKVHPCNDNYPFTAPVGMFEPNGFGLHDVLGNVWEWCIDDWHCNYVDAPSDGKAWAAVGMVNKVRRGGSWFSVPKGVRSAMRNGNYPEYAGNDTGFRLVKELK